MEIIIIILLFYILPAITAFLFILIYETLQGDKSIREIIHEEILDSEGYLLFIICPIFNIVIMIIFIFQILKTLCTMNKKEKPKKSYEKMYKDLETMLVYQNILTKEEIQHLIDSSSVIKQLTNKIKH